MIVSMGQHVFRGRYERNNTHESFGYKVFFDAGRFETSWQATVYRGGEPCGRKAGVLEGTPPRLEAIRSIARLVEQAIDESATE